MIWSVSTADRFSGAAMPVCVVNASMSGLRTLCGGCDSRGKIARAGETAHDGGRCGDQGRHEVSAPALALTALEVAVARRGAALARRELVGVHAEAHRAAGEAPFGAELLEDLVQALGLRLEADARGSGHDHDAHRVRLAVTLDDRCEGAEILDAAVGA